MEPLDLIEQLADAIGLGTGEGRTNRSGLAIGPQQDDVADRTVIDAVEQLAARLAVPAHEPDADLQVLFLGLFTQGEHLAGRRAIHRDRLFHEACAGPSGSRS